jgi:hypothetical protein
VLNRRVVPELPKAARSAIQPTQRAQLHASAARRTDLMPKQLHARLQPDAATRQSGDRTVTIAAKANERLLQIQER